MALKSDRLVDVTEIGYFLNEAAEQGVIVSVSTAGSGVGLDNIANLATVSASASGAKPIGMLLNEFVSIDQTRIPRNWHKDQNALGDKATIMTKGWAVTNKITGTPTAGQTAVLTASGNASGQVLTATQPYDYTRFPYIGTFRTVKDENGYARLYVDL